ncbi:TPM domain-containing protein [Ichthyenterobacterium sp. W332]|uniref:TPM domain-containing protein n=1 Tax=Microcosmobacter mediterraneus TaxID=3075607 RepID=A0ABU2YH45_9FLAO|nr:TPM domain-containing protein [Ichthyenterobacterium sp. W332]MDT0557100.1 TPM domain-containing protein [Ichthyenterobacterium sp. W332]
MKQQIVFFILLICCCKLSFAQFDIPEKPKRTEDQTSLYDDINLLSKAQHNALEQKLIRYSDSTSTQIFVAIIKSTNNDDISLVATEWGERWGIGQATEDNGIVILLAKDDREIDISTGYGIEYRLTDILAERVINRIIIPEFKRGDFYGGLDKGTDAIFEVLNGEFKNDKINNEVRFPIEVFIVLFIFFIIFIIAITKNRRGGNGHGGQRHSGANDILEAIILSNMGKGSYRRSSGGFGGWSSGGSSSSGGSFGGGFSGGFGGGSFGGGGASGSW